MALIVLVMVVLGVGSAAVLGSIFIAQRALAPGSHSSDDPRLAEQADRIAVLEAEVHRLREQADFTERLLSDRSVEGTERTQG